MKSISVQHVKYLPKTLSPDVLYVSNEYAVAGHMCACGCGAKVITPLGQVEWMYSERNGRPTLRPSIGNWQLACQSHYFIIDGQIKFEGQWSHAQTAAGRSAEERRRQEYYGSAGGKGGFGRWLYNLVRRLFGYHN